MSANVDVVLTWRVHAPEPAPNQPDDGLTGVRLVELDVLIGSKHQRIAVGSLQGLMYANEQRVCAAADAGGAYSDEVARVTFMQGGVVGFAVRRTSPEVLIVVHYGMTDGLCTDESGAPTACPSASAVAATLSIPAKAKVTERLVEVDAAGTITPLAC